MLQTWCLWINTFTLKNRFNFDAYCSISSMHISALYWNHAIPRQLHNEFPCKTSWSIGSSAQKWKPLKKSSSIYVNTCQGHTSAHVNACQVHTSAHQRFSFLYCTRASASKLMEYAWMMMCEIVWTLRVLAYCDLYFSILLIVLLIIC